MEIMNAKIYKGNPIADAQTRVSKTGKRKKKNLFVGKARSGRKKRLERSNRVGEPDREKIELLFNKKDVGKRYTRKGKRVLVFLS